MPNLFLSFVSTLFWSSILICILHWVRKTELLQTKRGVSCLVVICCACMIRMCLSLDFGLQIGVSCPGLFSDIYEKAVLNTYQIGSWNASILK